MSTPLLVVVKVARILWDAMAALGPDVLRDDVRRVAVLPLPLADEIGEMQPPPPAETEPDLAELLNLYRGVVPGQRRALVNLLRATSESLVPATSTRSAVR